MPRERLTRIDQLYSALYSTPVSPLVKVTECSAGYAVLRTSAYKIGSDNDNQPSDSLFGHIGGNSLCFWILSKNGMLPQGILDLEIVGSIFAMCGIQLHDTILSHLKEPLAF